MKQNSGIVKHLHHNYLFEWGWGFRERIEAIDTGKPEHQGATRKRLLGFLTKKEIAMLPKDFVDICKVYGKADQKREEANQKRREAIQKWEEVYLKYKPQLEEVHKKICGCKEWNGEEIVFEK